MTTDDCARVADDSVRVKALEVLLRDADRQAAVNRVEDEYWREKSAIYRAELRRIAGISS